MARRREDIMVRDRNPHPPVVFDDRNVFSKSDHERVAKVPMNHPTARIRVHIGELERDVNDPIHLR
jgi:hypothetical protein